MHNSTTQSCNISNSQKVRGKRSEASKISRMHRRQSNRALRRVQYRQYKHALRQQAFTDYRAVGQNRDTHQQHSDPNKDLSLDGIASFPARRHKTAILAPPPNIHNRQFAQQAELIISSNSSTATTLTDTQRFFRAATHSNTPAGNQTHTQQVEEQAMKQKVVAQSLRPSTATSSNTPKHNTAFHAFHLKDYFKVNTEAPQNPHTPSHCRTGSRMKLNPHTATPTLHIPTPKATNQQAHSQQATRASWFKTHCLQPPHHNR